MSEERAVQGLILEHFTNVRNAMIVDFVRSKELDHGPLMGQLRETFVDKFLRSHLPAHLVIGSGFVIDWRQGRSRQQDIVLYRSDLPKLNIDQYDYFFIEGVVGTIEVKSNLTERELFTALDNARSVRQLTRLESQGWIAPRRAFSK